VSSNGSAEYEEYKRNGRVWGMFPQDRIRKIAFPRHSKDICDRFTKIADITGVIADIVDSMGLRCVVAASHVPPILRGKRIAGTVVTQRAVPERKVNARSYVDGAPSKMSAFDLAYLSEPGDVLVADFGGNPDASNGGGNSILAMKMCGLSGAVMYGAVRDVDSIIESDFPVWSSGVTPMSGKFRLETIEINGPVTVHDVAVYPGDLAVCDDSGVAFIPPDYVAAVLEAAEEEEERGLKIREALEKRAPMPELRKFFQKEYKSR
jgi:regulator of RNase E activity RraA